MYVCIVVAYLRVFTANLHKNPWEFFIKSIARLLLIYIRNWRYWKGITDLSCGVVLFNEMVFTHPSTLENHKNFIWMAWKYYLIPGFLLSKTSIYSISDYWKSFIQRYLIQDFYNMDLIILDMIKIITNTLLNMVILNLKVIHILFISCYHWKLLWLEDIFLSLPAWVQRPTHRLYFLMGANNPLL